MGDLVGVQEPCILRVLQAPHVESRQYLQLGQLLITSDSFPKDLNNTVHCERMVAAVVIALVISDTRYFRLSRHSWRCNRNIDRSKRQENTSAVSISCNDMTTKMLVFTCGGAGL